MSKICSYTQTRYIEDIQVQCIIAREIDVLKKEIEQIKKGERVIVNISINLF